MVYTNFKLEIATFSFSYNLLEIVSPLGWLFPLLLLEFLHFLNNVQSYFFGREMSIVDFVIILELFRSTVGIEFRKFCRDRKSVV